MTDHTPTDWRALCAELVFCWSRTTNPDDFSENAAPIIERMSAALAQPEPRMVYRYSPVTIAECGGPCEQGPQYCDCGEIKGELEPQPELQGPTDEEIDDWHGRCADLTRVGEADHYWAFDFRHDEVADVVRAALARWGTPANTINQEN
jgi:hypothetical protein